jgi:hypothetical protein
MLLIEAVQADANTLPGFQHHTLLCLATTLNADWCSRG